MPVSRPATIVLAALAFTTSLASAQPMAATEVAPAAAAPALGYVAANVIPDAPAPIEYSVEAGYRIASSPVFAHAELGSGSHAAAVGIELRGCSGQALICGAAGVDAAYAMAAAQIDPVIRLGTDIGGAFRFRLGIDVPVSRDGNTITPLDMQLKLGIARVF